MKDMISKELSNVLTIGALVDTFTLRPMSLVKGGFTSRLEIWDDEYEYFFCLTDVTKNHTRSNMRTQINSVLTSALIISLRRAQSRNLKLWLLYNSEFRIFVLVCFRICGCFFLSSIDLSSKLCGLHSFIQTTVPVPKTREEVLCLIEQN